LSQWLELFDSAHDRGDKAIALSRVDPVIDSSSTVNKIVDRRLMVGLLALLICVFIQISVEMLEGETRAFVIATLNAAELVTRSA
jgi:hypothetical protein